MNMNRKELINGLIAHGVLFAGEHPSGIKGNCSLLRWLARNGFAASEQGYVYATAATPLALLTPSCLKRAEKLANGLQNRYCMSLAECKLFDVLTDAGFAVANRSGYHPTEKLIAAVKCWREAKGSGNQ